MSAVDLAIAYARLDRKFEQEEPTTEFVLAERCPSCRSLETEPFETHVDGTKHCLPCGRVFR